MNARFAYQTLLALLFPLACDQCGAYGAALCANCARAIPEAQSFPVPHSLALFRYEHPTVKKSLWQLKYHQKSELAEALIIAAAQRICDWISNEAAAPRSSEAMQLSVALLPVPISNSKKKQRGFNQAALLCSWVQDYCSRSASPGAIAFYSDSNILSRTAEQRLPQAKIPLREDRLKNARNTMAARQEKQHGNQQNDRADAYIIVDDVTTTGATFLEARRALVAAGYDEARLYCLALAHGTFV